MRMENHLLNFYCNLKFLYIIHFSLSILYLLFQILMGVVAFVF